MINEAETMKLTKDFFYSDFVDNLIAARLIDDYKTLLSFINKTSEAVANNDEGDVLDNIDMEDFDQWMNDLTGIQQVLSMYVVEVDLEAPVIPHTLMEAWVKWQTKGQ
jgi:hypothetical protein